MPPAAAPAAPTAVVLPLTTDARALTVDVAALAALWPADVDADLVVPTRPLAERDRAVLAELGEDVRVVEGAPRDTFGALVARAAATTRRRLLVLEPGALPGATALSGLARGQAAPGGVLVDSATLARTRVLTAAGDLRALASLLTARPGRQRRGPVRVSAALIVKDEQAALPACLASLTGAVDEVVVCDTGSSDRTVEVARAFGARVVSTVWRDDFAAARNAALSHCRGSWVLSIDADEQLALPPGAALHSLVAGADVDALALRLLSHTDRGGAGGYEHDALRLFRRGPLRWAGAVHESLCTAGGDPPSAARLEGVHLVHDGYRGTVCRARDKAARNLALAEKEAAARDRAGRPAWKTAYELARAVSAAGGPAERQEHLLREALAALPGEGVEHVRAGASVRLARLLSGRGAHEEAVGHARAALDVLPGAPGARLALARALQGSGRTQEALDALDAHDGAAGGTGAARDRADDELARPSLRAALLLALGRPHEAAQVWAALARTRPGDVDWSGLAQALQADGGDWAAQLVQSARDDPAPLVAALAGLPGRPEVLAALHAAGVDPGAWSPDAVLARAAADALSGFDPEALAAAALALEEEDPAGALAVWRTAPPSARSRVGAARCLLALDRVGDALDAVDGLDPAGLDPADLLTVVLLAEHAGDRATARALLDRLPPQSGPLAQPARDAAERLAPCR